jgi:mRNA interferase MazF
MVRGEVFRLKARRRSKGHEQQRARYGVVVQSDEFLGFSTTLVAPTSTAARPTPFRPAISLEGIQTRVLVEHTMAVDSHRLGRSVGRLDAVELLAIDEALRLVLAL